MEGDLLSLQVLLDDDSLAGVAEETIFHDLLDRIHRLWQLETDNSSLSRRQAIGLDDQRDTDLMDVSFGLLCPVERLEEAGGDTVLLHEALGEDLTPLNEGSILPW